MTKLAGKIYLLIQQNNKKLKLKTRKQASLLILYKYLGIMKKFYSKRSNSVN